MAGRKPHGGTGGLWEFVVFDGRKNYPSRTYSPKVFLREGVLSVTEQGDSSLRPSRTGQVPSQALGTEDLSEELPSTGGEHRGWSVCTTLTRT